MWSEFRDSIEHKKHGPLFLFIYILTISSVESVLSLIISSSAWSLWGFFINLFSLSLLFVSIILVSKILFDFDRPKLFSRELMKFYWLIVISPIILNVSPSMGVMGSLDFSGVFFVIILIGVMYIISLGSRSKRNSKTSHTLLRHIFGLILLIGFGLIVFIQRAPFGLKIFDIYSSAGFLILLIVENILILSMLFYLENKKLFFSLLRSVKPFRTLHFIVIVLIGYFVYLSLSGTEFFIYDTIFIFISSMCMVFTWQFSTMLNDYYDINIDKIVHPKRPLVQGKIDPDAFREIAALFGMITITISLLFSIELLILNILFVIAGILYSIPSIRLKNKVYGHICVGYGSFVSFLYGVFGILTLKNVDYFLYTNDISIEFFSEILSFTLIIFLVFSISPLINAIKDYEGDKKANVRNIYTVYGFDKGKKIVSILIIFLFVTPLILFHSIVDWIVILPLSFMASYIFYKYEKYKVVFLLYFIIIIHIIFKFVM